MSQILQIVCGRLNAEVLFSRCNHASLVGFVENRVAVNNTVIYLLKVLDDKVIGVHVAVECGSYDISVLMHPQGVFLPAGLIPITLVGCTSRRNVTGDDGFHVAVAQVLQLDTQPVKLAVSRLCFGGTSIDGRV